MSVIHTVEQPVLNPKYYYINSTIKIYTATKYIQFDFQLTNSFLLDFFQLNLHSYF
jgi:hypothetical protein